MPFDGKNTPLRDFLLWLRAQPQRRTHRELRAALPEKGAGPQSTWVALGTSAPSSAKMGR
jgi:hypothetical protein